MHTKLIKNVRILFIVFVSERNRNGTWNQFYNKFDLPFQTVGNISDITLKQIFYCGKDEGTNDLCFSIRGI